jgi:N-acetyl-anhydromuramyl-L-alanine amidase AmpD
MNALDEMYWAGTDKTNKSSRNGQKVLAIVDHITDGTAESCLQWFNDLSNTSSSAHFLVARNGRIFQFVKISESAWHCGISGARVEMSPSELVREMGISTNAYTIGIEHEGYDGNGLDGTLTEKQYEATLNLHCMLIDICHITVDKKHILGHCEINPWDRAYCPGINFPWTRLMSDLQAHYTPIPSPPIKEVDEIMTGEEIIKALESTDQEELANHLRKVLKIEDASWAKIQVDLLRQRNLLKSDHDANEIMNIGVLSAIINNMYDELKKLLQLK